MCQLGPSVGYVECVVVYRFCLFFLFCFFDGSGQMCSLSGAKIL